MVTLYGCSHNSNKVWYVLIFRTCYTCSQPEQVVHQSNSAQRILVCSVAIKPRSVLCSDILNIMVYLLIIAEINSVY